MTHSASIPTSVVDSQPGPVANFRDPAGLLLRMLRSRDAAAWAALTRETLKLVAAPVDALLRRQDQKLTASAAPSQLPVILIVGAPRSGTTLLYQALSRFLSVSYLNNLTALFPSSPISSTRYFSRILRSPSDQFHSYYGQTSRLADPNDGFHLWNRWFGSDRSDCGTGLSADDIKEMRRFFDAWHAVTGRPFVNKNNRNTACMTLLNNALQNVFFVIVRREPLFVVQSLINARRAIQGDDKVGWGLFKQDVERDAGPLAHVDAVCDQVVAIEHMIRDHQNSIPPERCIEVNYEAFCGDPASTLRHVADCVGHVELINGVEDLQPGLLRLNKTITLADEEIRRASERIDRQMQSSEVR